MSWLSAAELSDFTGYIRIRGYIEGVDSPQHQGKILVMWMD